jgi:hypothetical protein
MADSTHTTDGFLKALAPHIVAELQPPSNLAKFTRNTDVMGAYVESAVRKMIAYHVAPLHVATGTVIDETNTPGDPKLPQVDIIIWAPCPVPAVFQVGEFAVVPRSSSLAVMEVKSSAYDIPALDDRLDDSWIYKLTAALLPNEYPKPAGLGVICVRKAGQGSTDKMRNPHRVVILFDEEGDDYKPRPMDIYRLVNFLAFVRKRAQRHEGEAQINLSELK